MELHGVIAPICTPFGTTGEIRLDAVRRNIAAYIGAGLTGFVVAGSTGEAPFLSREEKQQLFHEVRQAADGAVLIAGTGVESAREAIALIRDAADLDYDAALVLTPHYYRGQMSRPETQTTFFQSVADSSSIPILIYNFPQMTGIDLPLDVILQLSEHPNIIGIKESSADLDRIGTLTSSLPVTFKVLVGASAMFHQSLCLGATGGVLAIANAIPHSTRLIYECYRSGDVPKSRALQQKIVDAASVAPRYGIQGLKYAIDLKGYFGGPTRLPLLPLVAQQKAEIERLFQNIVDEPDAPTADFQ